MGKYCMLVCSNLEYCEGIIKLRLLWNNIEYCYGMIKNNVMDSIPAGRIRRSNYIHFIDQLQSVKSPPIRPHADHAERVLLPPSGSIQHTAASPPQGAIQISV
jgi:hypothetical protein